MESANSHQVGGTHYKSEYIHWDLVIRLDMGYLEGVATKYLVRWQSKGDPEGDLKKSIHYIEKLIESIYLVRSHRRPLRFIHQEVDQFCVANRLGVFEQDAVMRLATWETERDLKAVRNCVQHLLDSYISRLAEPKPAPLTDSNKHAERA